MNAILAALAQVLEEWDHGALAVIDGAAFANAPSAFANVGLAVQPLFLETGSRPAPTSGPFVVSLDPPARRRFLSVPRVEQSCVLWRGPVDAVLAYRHFRGLNQARIPCSEALDGTDRVLFRHWDPAVLALTFPLMTAAQRARLFGPLRGLALYSTDERRVVQARWKASWPRAPRGALTFSPAQMEAISEGMRRRSHRKVALYLRRNAEEHTAPLDDAALVAFVAESEVQAREWGVRSEAGLGRFAWLQLVTQSRFASMPDVRTAVSADGTPDANLRKLMNLAAFRMRHGIV